MQISTDDYSHLKTRPQNFFKKAFIDIDAEQLTDKGQNFEKILLSSPCDLGVALNGGRIGAKYGPACILNSLGKFQTYQDGLKILNKSALKGIVPNTLAEMQVQQAAVIRELLLGQKWNKLVHLGGGHDHVFPLLKALTDIIEQDKINPTARLICLNVDAHLDTRTDKQVHSGTPFRQWMQAVAKLPEHLRQRVRFEQMAIHQQSNHPSNYQLAGMVVNDFLATTTSGFPLDHADALLDLDLNENDIVLLSLDCDVFDASEFPAVSAPNGRGLAVEKFRELLNTVVALPGRKVFGVYEYNPLFDDLATSCARKLAFLIEHFLLH